MRALVVAHAGPFIGPSAQATVAFVVIEKPGHREILSGSQAILAAGDEFNKSAVAQVLKLLAHLGSDVLIAGIEVAKMPFESIDLLKGEITLAERLHTFHDVK
jgi:hypothetical protein